MCECGACVFRGVLSGRFVVCDVLRLFSVVCRSVGRLFGCLCIRLVGLCV